MLLTVVFMPGLSGSDNIGSKAEAEILKVDNAYQKAVLAADAMSLSKIFDDDVLIIHSDGTTDNKGGFIGAISSGRLKMSTYTRSGVSVRVYNGVAMLFSQTRKTFLYKGSQATDEDVSIITYVNKGGVWRIVAMQNTHRQ